MSNLSIPLYNLAPLSPPQLDRLLAQIRSTEYIKEVTSGEVAPEESGLWDQVLPVPPRLHPVGDKAVECGKKEGQEGLVSHALSTLFSSSSASSAKEGDDGGDGDGDEEVKGKYANGGIVIADARTRDGDGSVLVLEVNARGAEGERVLDSMRCAPGSLIEVCANLAVANMSLSEYKNMCGNAEVFDAGQ